MKIAVDYDETFTADPVAFKAMVEAFKERGHDVKFVTFRDPKWVCNDDICADAQDLDIEIVFTAGKQKQHVYQADIWIDDTPSLIVSYDELCGVKVGCEKSNDTKVIE